MFIAIGVAVGFLSAQFFDSNEKAAEEAGGPVNFEISSQDHMLGKADAAKQIVVFNDLACPPCREYNLTLREFANAHEDTSIVWRHFPLNRNETDSIGAATASECAGAEGKFWEFIFALSQSEEDYSDELYSRLAVEHGLESEEFENCLADKRYQGRVEADYYEGIVKGVIAAPATFVNGQYVPGAIPLYRLNELLGQ